MSYDIDRKVIYENKFDGWAEGDVTLPAEALTIVHDSTGDIIVSKTGGGQSDARIHLNKEALDAIELARHPQIVSGDGLEHGPHRLRAGPLDLVASANSDGTLSFAMTFNDKVLADMGTEAAKLFARFVDDTFDRTKHWRMERQRAVYDWALRCFGEAHVNSLPQRALRLLEEAVEAYQATGGPKEAADNCVNVVFSRPIGELYQELGGIGVTLLCLAQAAGLDANQAEHDEVKRVLSLPPEHFRKRNQEKNALGLNLAGDMAEAYQTEAPTDAKEAA